jgi:hypothetical protein
MAVATPVPAQVVDTEKRIKELTNQIVLASMNDPTKAQELTRELSKLLRSQQDVMVEKVTQARVAHQGTIEGVIQAAQEEIAEYVKTNALPAFTFSVGFGHADEKANGYTFKWAGQSAKGKRRGAGGGRKQPGMLKQNGNALGAYDSATAAVRALAAQGAKDKQGNIIAIPLHPESKKPTRNAALVLSDAGYEWVKTGPASSVTQ